jgi:phasin family protein
MNVKSTKATLDEAIDTSARSSSREFENTLSATRDAVSTATRGFETSQLKLKEGVEKAMKSSQELLFLSKGNLEAFMAASKILATGLQGISKELVASNKATIEESVSFTKSLFGVKSFREAVDLHSGFALSSIHKAVSDTGKVTDATVQLAEQAVAPLAARLTIAIEKFGPRA